MLTAVSVALLSSCSSQDRASETAPSATTATVTETVTPAPTETPAQTPESSTRSSEEEDFLSRMEGAGEDIPVDAEQTVIDLGQMVCFSLDQGKDITWSGQKMMNNGFTMDQSGHVIGAAIFAFCPEHTDVIQ